MRDDNSQQQFEQDMERAFKEERLAELERTVVEQEAEIRELMDELKGVTA